MEKQEGKLIDTVGERPSVSTSQPKVKNKVGRPSDYTQATADLICSHIGQGKSLRYVTTNVKGVPSMVTVYAWMREQPEFLKQYARAKEDSAEALADDIMDISDGVLSGRYDPQAARVALDGKKWTASKLKPKKYGDFREPSTGPTINFNLPSQKYLADDVKQAINEAQVSQNAGEIPNTTTTDDINASD